MEQEKTNPTNKAHQLAFLHTLVFTGRTGLAHWENSALMVTHGFK